MAVMSTLRSVLYGQYFTVCTLRSSLRGPHTARTLPVNERPPVNTPRAYLEEVVGGEGGGEPEVERFRHLFAWALVQSPLPLRHVGILNRGRVLDGGAKVVRIHVRVGAVVQHKSRGTLTAAKAFSLRRQSAASGVKTSAARAA